MFFCRFIDKSYKVKSDNDKEELAEITGFYIIIIGFIMEIIYLLSMIIDVKILLVIVIIMISVFHYKIYKSLNKYKNERTEENNF